MFHNTQINAEGLPDFRILNWDLLDKKYLKANFTTLACILIIPWGLIIINLTLNIPDFPAFLFWLVPLLLTLISGFLFWLTWDDFHKKSYALREKDIFFREGVFWKSLTCIPFNRVQHCEVKQGPIDRMFGLSQLVIYTAGGASSDLIIPGLPLEKANKIKVFILNKTTHDDEQE